MGRPTRSERLALAKGRPKRRAAGTHFFKYQLSSNPSRAEENDLKRALQESLEEQDSVNGKGIKKNKITNNSIDNRVINSSTNSSDVSKSSNISSSTSFDISGTTLISTRNTRSKTPSPSTITPTSCKLTRSRNSFNHQHYNKNITDSKKECDSEPSVLSDSPTLRSNVSKAIKTYSRNQTNLNGQQQKTSKQQLQKQTCDSGPRSSTPIPTTSVSNGISNGNPLGEELQIYVSKSTQTSAPEVSFSTKPQVSKQIDVVGQESAGNSVGGNTISKTVAKIAVQKQPVQEQYLKFKRESKNYAYAKMTALKVNTSKSPSSNPKSSNKKSPNGILNNNNTNKDSKKTAPKTVTVSSFIPVQASSGIKLAADSNSSPNQSKSSVKADARQNLDGSKASSSGSSIKAASHDNFKTSDCLVTNLKQRQSSADKNVNNDRIFQVDATSQSLIRELVRNEANNFSVAISNNQQDMSVSMKRAPDGSWSLLGVPEEKVIYLRDDEPPRRLICYPAIKHVEGDVIQVRDSVLLRSGAKKTDLPYIAKVCAFWEDAETGSIMMSLFWYYRPEHTEEGRKSHHLSDEIFASRHRDVDSVECIEDKCYVLTYNEYCRYKKRCKMEQVNTTWSLTDVTIPVSNESYPRRSRIPDVYVNSELVFCCRQIYDSRMRRFIKNPLINSKYGTI